jgi:hypothetical protein
VQGKVIKTVVRGRTVFERGGLTSDTLGAECCGGRVK